MTIYLDNNATTPIDPVVFKSMLPYLKEEFGNPSSVYSLGRKAAAALQLAREQVARLLDCEPSEILFTGSGTEATNAAIRSALAADPDRQHIVTTRVEHSATQKLCESLAKKGVEITWIGVDAHGRLCLEDVEKALRPDTALLSVMWANNETGTIFPIAELEKLAHDKGVYFHTDAVQALGKVPIQLRSRSIQFLSLSGHKLHAPKGVGALYINRKSRFTPFLIGGGQEQGRRAGTENVSSIIGLGTACEIVKADSEKSNLQVGRIRDHFEQTLLNALPNVNVNGDVQARLSNTCNLSFEGCDGETLLMLLDNESICCSAGSACTSGSVSPSHVLKAMGLSDTQARSSLRFSFSRYNTVEETNKAIQAIINIVKKVSSS